MGASDDITRLLGEVDAGREGAMDDLMGAVYTDLQRVAERHMAEQFGRGLPGITLEPAALVNESFLRLIKQRKSYDNRGQFFAIATKLMLRVLVDYQRKRRAAKRGGGRQRITLSLEGPPGTGAVGMETRSIEVESLVDALGRLEKLDQRKADVVRLRVIWGLEIREIAESLGISRATVERDWSFAKAWLGREAAISD
ncbi:MAG: sigma-70 family RNA polymerase sigma factor [Phycisphaerales bacterium]|nr:MAG: sigma-70 family RNA polymerase sigma factor [Phycisphaerales bacterium]